MKNCTLLFIMLFPVWLNAQTNLSNNPHVNETNMDFYFGYGTVWEGKVDGAQRIFHNDESTTQVLPSTSMYDKSPRIYQDNQVTWEGFDGNDTEIHFYNGTTTTKLTDNTFPDLSPRIFEDRITWYGGEGTVENDYEVFLYNGATVQQLTNNNYNDINPKIYNSEVVWQGFDGNDYEIFYYNGSYTQQLTHNQVDDINPQVESGIIVWQQYDGQDYEIMYYYGNNNTYQVTHNNVDDINPFISWARVAWTAKEGGDYDIFYFDRVTVFNLTSNDVHDEFLGFSAGRIVWIGNEDADGEIFCTQFLPAIKSSNISNSILQITYNNLKEFGAGVGGKSLSWSSEALTGSHHDREIYGLSTVGPGEIILEKPVSTSFVIGEKYTINFTAYGDFKKGVQFSAQLSNVNSDDFPTIPVILASNTTNTIDFTIPNIPSGTYKLRIISQAYYTSISNTLEITVSEPPSVFITSLANNATKQKVKLNLTAKAVVNASSYTFNIVPQGETWESGIIQTGSRTQVVDSLAYNTAYNIRVKTNLNPEYGKTITFTTAPAEDFAFVTSPANNTKGVKLHLNVTANNVLYATQYTIELNTDSLFTDSTAFIKSGDRTIQFGNLAVNTTYYSRVKTNLSSIWGKTHSFTTASALALSYLVVPSNNAINVPINPILMAYNITESNNYAVQLSTSNDFMSSPVLEKKGTTPTLVFAGLNYNTVYYARVSTTLATGWGRITSFTTRPASSYSYVTSPSNLAINQPLTLTVRSNKVEGASRYIIELNTASDFTGTSIVQSSPTNVVTFTSLAPNTTYFNRVQTDLDTTWGAVRSFTTKAVSALQERKNTLIEPEDLITINTYPNPFHIELNVMVRSSYNEDIEIKLVDFTGQEVSNIKTTTNNVVQVGEKAIPGIYILKIKMRNVVRTLQIVKI